ncbi:MAG: hypothetical protein H0U76_18430 [Ktedonobacteraceae bacterium]|nr:hypothetical protein [Ktedonobacteraceae bacterium]
MGLDFLKNNGAQRVRSIGPRPLLLEEGRETIDATAEVEVLNYERELEDWQGIDIQARRTPRDWPWRPLHFIDGKNIGRTVAWLQTRHGYPIPIRLAEIGAATMEDRQGQLRREYEVLERVVSLVGEPFPWDEVESFASELQDLDIRFLPCRPSGLTYSFDLMRKAVQNRTQEEMDLLERQALALNAECPTLIDGRLEPRVGAFDQETAPIVGLIKTHARVYLPLTGLSLLHDLLPGQRTPAFCVGNKLKLVTWYLRLNGQQGELPDWGVIRLEIARAFFETIIKKDFTYLDDLSHIVYEYRCRDQSYGRAPISIYPIQRVEESLGSLFSPTETLVQRFYRYTSI